MVTLGSGAAILEWGAVGPKVILEDANRMGLSGCAGPLGEPSQGQPQRGPAIEGVCRAVMNDTDQGPSAMFSLEDHLKASAGIPDGDS